MTSLMLLACTCMSKSMSCSSCSPVLTNFYQIFYYIAQPFSQSPGCHPGSWYFIPNETKREERGSSWKCVQICLYTVFIPYLVAGVTFRFLFWLWIYRFEAKRCFWPESSRYNWFLMVLVKVSLYNSTVCKGNKEQLADKGVVREKKTAIIFIFVLVASTSTNLTLIFPKQRLTRRLQTVDHKHSPGGSGQAMGGVGEGQPTPSVHTERKWTTERKHISAVLPSLGFFSACTFEKTDRYVPEEEDSSQKAESRNTHTDRP